jgi:hypothetical protein
MKKLIAICCVVFIAGFAVGQNKTTTTTQTKTTATGTQTKPKVEKIKTEIKTADLMKEITDHIAKNYVGYTISKAEKVSTDKVITYDVVVVKGDAKSTLTYNDKGAFVKAKVHPVATKTTTTGTKK